ncbi:MAG: hypothetical protein JO345_21345 [Streptosporangiaceae bacterium]|nr:hypothetical protein [Streptosporangiaceae bacterium]
MITDPALEFWLRHVAADGGLWEPAGDSAYVVLPAQLRDAYRLPEELRVTADPDVAREDGATLLTAGHPVLAEAADRVLAVGDAGYLVLDRPAGVPPGRDVLQAEVREAFPADHGRIDVSGEPAFVLHPVVRVGALVSYELSAEDRFQEEAERWVDVPSRREIPAALARSLSKALYNERTVVPPAENLLPAIGHAHRLMDSAAISRRAVLAAEVSSGFEAERGRAAAYYADAIAGIERRLATAAPDRAAVLRERLRATREEQVRRLAEIAEKYEARHVIRPYRLHVLLVPALRVAADVLRGSRRYPMSFDWLLPAGVYAPVRCPSCSAEAGLVAGKEKLGCEACLPPKPATVASATKPAAPAKPPAAKPPVAPSVTSPKPSRREAGPPQARGAQQKARAALAERVWSAVASGDRRTLARVLRPDSPAAALARVYGPAAFTGIIGMPAGEAPERFTAAVDAETVHGVLLGSSGAEYHYFIPSQDGQAAEVLPFPVIADGTFWRSYWWGRRPDARWSGPAVKGLEPVERKLAVAGRDWNGLPVAARALAAWDRLGDTRDRLLSAHQPDVLAACVIRLVAYRAGGKATFASVADHFRLAEEDVRRADRAVRPLLALGPGRPWLALRPGV